MRMDIPFSAQGVPSLFVGEPHMQEISQVSSTVHLERISEIL